MGYVHESFEEKGCEDFGGDQPLQNKKNENNWLGLNYLIEAGYK